MLIDFGPAVIQYRRATQLWILSLSYFSRFSRTCFGEISRRMDTRWDELARRLCVKNIDIDIDIDIDAD